jgi:hypothetical protein
VRWKSGLLIDDDIGGGRLYTFLIVLWVINKHQVAFFYFVYLVNAPGYTFLFAYDLCAN